MTLDYQLCTVNGRLAIELFDARTGCPLTFSRLPDRTPCESQAIVAERSA